jgi:hypothetical protein
MDDRLREHLVPGAKVLVTHRILHGNDVWTQPVRGVVIAYEQRPTGSWFAHAKGDRLWLDRLVIRQDNGEITTLNLDELSTVEVEAPPAKASQGDPVS